MAPYVILRGHQAFLAETKPISHVDALEKPGWKDAIDEEYRALLHNNTWELVSLRPGVNIIDCK